MRAEPGSSCVLWGVVAAVSAGLLAFSQTLAFWGDEGWYLLGTHLVQAGYLPYRDFFYCQVPLYAYLNAGWMWVFGDSWRSAHLLSALATSGSLILAAGFVFARIPDRPWKQAIALTAVAFIGLHELTVQLGTVAMPYAVCLFFAVAAFRLTIKAVETGNGWLAAGAGLFAGASAATTLLGAPFAPILCLWMGRYAGAALRRRLCGNFLAAAALPFLPVLGLAAEAPRRALFNIISFNVLYYPYPLSALEESLWQELVVFYRVWIGSPQGVLLVLFGILGLVFLVRQTQWSKHQRAEFYLCAWLTGGLGLFLAGTLDASDPYFMLLIPFLGILASLGVYAIALRIGNATRPGWLIVLVIGIFTVGLGEPTYNFVRESAGGWRHYDVLAREVNQATPPGGLVWGDAFIYVATQRVSPRTMAIASHPYLLHVPEEIAFTMQMPSSHQLDVWLASGRFATVALDALDSSANKAGLPRLYAKQERLYDYHIFSNRRIRSK